MKDSNQSVQSDVLVVEGEVDRATQSIPSHTEILNWVTSYLANLLEVDPDEVDITVPFDRYGLDSLAAVGLTGDLSDWLEREVEPTLLYDYPTVEGLVQYLSSEFNAQN
ncbi:MAG: acyl carrier protein [Leptolyngbyaceae cyanobacterium SM1_3_5]|nr:acyl carrier protein [Leptolyngbyaceae cyanobacterium SM1_3_5]